MTALRAKPEKVFLAASDFRKADIIDQHVCLPALTALGHSGVVIGLAVADSNDGALNTLKVLKFSRIGDVSIPHCKQIVDVVVVCELLAHQYLEPCSLFLSNVLSERGVLAVWLAIEANKEGVVKEAGVGCLERSNYV